MAAVSAAFLAIIGTYLLEISHKSKCSGSLHSMQHAVDTWMAKQAAGAVAAAVVSPGSTEYVYGGKLTSNDRTLPNKHTIFEVGSVTKGFTGLLLADQVLVGNVFLNETLLELLTDWEGRFSSPAGNVSLLELTTHSSGLGRRPGNFKPKDPSNPYADYTLQQLYEWLNNVDLSNRSTYIYSNTGVGVLGHALAVTADTTYEDLLKERVLLPLGLRDTTITLNEGQKNRMALGHFANGTSARNWDFDVLAPAAGMRSSVSDLARFLRFAIGLNKNGRQLNQALKFAIQRRGNMPLRNSTSIGCNWFRSVLPQDHLLVWHIGDTGGFGAYLGWLPERQIGVVVLASITNYISNAEDLALELLKLKLSKHN